MKRWHVPVMAAGAALILSLTACGTGGNAQEETAATGGGGAGETRDLSFAVVIHGDPDGSFWNVVKKGAEDAGRQYGVQVTVTGDQEGAQQAALINTAIAQQPDGMVVSMANPDALQTALGDATAAGIPFVTINSGADESKAFGAIGHVGQTETIAGQGAGEQMKTAGVTKMLCLIHEAGNIGLQQRCDGAAQGFGGSVENLQVDLNDPAAIQATVQSRLLGDPSIDGILSLNPTVTTAAVAGVKAGNSTAKVGSFDIDTDVLDAIKAGDVLFTVDQQQYLQGYLPIAMLVLYKDNLNTIGGGQPVLTGPSFITSENVDTVADLVANGTR